MKNYNEYKPSEIEWIGDIPAEWNTIKLKWLTPIKRGASPRPIDDLKYFDENGEFAWVRIADVTASERYLEQTTERLSELGASLSVKRYPGDFFVSIAGSVGKPIITKIKCCIHDGFVWFPELTINPEYLFYIFQTGLPFIGLGKLGTQLNLNTETIGNISIPNLTKENIECIVKYLNHQTAIIDQLILQEEKLIELLKEKRQAVINEALTKGLDPNAKMKDSGIKWLGEVPNDWLVRRIGFIADLITGFPWKSELFDFEEGIKIVRGENVSEGFLRWGDRTRFWKQEVEIDSKYFLNENDIVIAMDGSKVGKNYVLISSDDLPLLLHQRMCRLRVRESILPKFISYYIGSDMFKYYIDISKTDPMVPHITQKNIFDFELVIPSFQLQQDIVNYLDEKIDAIEDLTSKEERQIEKLKEYRKSIIAEAVTGKIDVRDWQPNKQQNN